jgi:hypothetical protein
MRKYYIEEIRKTTFGGDKISIFHIFRRFFWIFKYYEMYYHDYIVEVKIEFNSIEDAQKRVECLKNSENKAKERRIIKTERIIHEHN